MLRIIPFLIVLDFKVCTSYRILLVFPFPSKSHAILGESFVNLLLAEGHEITYITQFPVADPPTKLRQVDISPVSGIPKINHVAINKLFNKGLDHLNHNWDAYFSISKRTLSHDNIRALLMDEEIGFDAVVADWMFSELYAGYYSSKESEIYIEAFSDAVTKRGRTLPPLDVMRFNASLMLSNTHAALGVPLRLPQSYKPVGGYHISGKIKESMTEDLKRILDDSIKGIIYFSLGTELDTSRLPLAMKGALLQMFKGLEQTVLWKMDEDAPANWLGNVHVTKWAPQQSVLAHPNTKLFITHGGMLSILEAVHFAVPTVVVPAFGDQFLQAACVVRNGMGKRVLLTSDLHIGLKEAVLEVLTNKSYKQNAKKVSFAFRHRLRSARFEIPFWVKHVIKTQGALHLRSTALLVPWYQNYFIDLVILVVCGLVGGFFGVKGVWVKLGRSRNDDVFIRKRKM